MGGHMNYIKISKEEIPYEFEMVLNGETFQFEVFYNSVGDYFTVNLYKNHNFVVYGEKLVYGVPLFDNLRHLNVPKVIIFPYDITKAKNKKADRISFDNLNEDVLLYVLD